MGTARAVTCRDNCSMRSAWPHPARAEHQQHLHGCSGGFYGGRIFFLWMNCFLKHIPFTHSYGGGS